MFCLIVQMFYTILVILPQEKNYPIKVQALKHECLKWNNLLLFEKEDWTLIFTVKNFLIHFGSVGQL